MSMVAPLGGSHPSQELGDTQVFPTQIITSYLEGKSRPSNPWEEGMQMNIDFDGTSHSEIRPYATGDTGYVNLVQTLETQEPDPSGPQGDYHSEEELATIPQVPSETVTSPTLLSSMTPSFAGQKRDHNGNLVSPLSRTPMPNLATFFTAGPRNGVMGLSQVFKQTQADSSPFPNCPRSDPIFERPSPDVRPLYHTSPIGTMSSPVYSTRPGMQRGTSEPRPIYVSMKHSQELRERQRRNEELMSLQLNSDEDDELGEGSEERRAARRRSTEKLRSDAMRTFATLGAPRAARMHSSKKKVGMRAVKGKTPNRISRRDSLLHDRDVIVISDDFQEGAEDSTESSELESMDEYDELSQAVISSERYEEELEDGPVEHRISAPRGRGVDRVTRAASSPLLLRERHSQDEQLRRSFPEASKSQSSGNGGLGLEAANFLRISQTVVVADSQPENDFEDHGLAQPPRPVLPSSIDSRGFISQSQGFSLSSNARVVLATTPLIDTGLGASSLPPVPMLYGLSDSEMNTLEHQDPPSSPPEMEHTSARKSTDRPDQPHDILHGSFAIFTRQAHDEAPAREEEVQTTTDSQGKLNARLGESNSQQRRSPVQAIPETSPTATPGTRSSSTLNSATGPHLRDKLSTRHTEADDEAHSESASAGVGTESVVQYQTAQSHQSLSPLGSSGPARHSEPMNATPPRPQIRRLTEIAADLPPPTPPNAKTFDITIMNDDDLDFHTTLLGSSPGSPPKKRVRRTYGRKILQEPAQEENSLPPRATSPAKASETAGNVPVANEENRSTVEQEETIVSTPPSVKRREELGAAAAVNARQNVTLRRTSSLPAIRKVQKTAGNFKQRSRKAATPPRAIRSEPRVEIDETPYTTRQRDPSLIREDETGLGSTASSTAHQYRAIETPDDQVTLPHTLHPHLHATVSRNPNVSNRVLARFKDQNMRFYPATCLGLAGPKSSVYRVRFDDGTIDQIDVAYIKRFELQIGDLVRIDLDDMRTKTWIVRELKDLLAPRERDFEGFMLTDILGHKTVVVEAKQRQSLPANGRLARSESVDVPISSLYFTTRDWRGIEDRQYQHHHVVDQGQRLQTPVNLPSLPNTPSSRTRRHTVGNIIPSAIQVSTDGYGTTTGIFSNMAFAITYSNSKDAEKTRICRSIVDNGGRILSDGFDELFDLPSTPLASPSKSPRTASTASPCHLTLSPAAAKLGFTALIADSHSRRAKYMQALALNIPCLSGRWIADCATKQQLLSWYRYLLPAGESSFLGGAIRSRTFAAHPMSPDGSATRLHTTIAERPKLLNGKNVILVMGKGKEEEKRRPYLFLTYALGASRVERVKDLKAAEAMLDEHGDGGAWDLVYVDGGKIEQARKQLGGAVTDVDAVAGVEQRGKKRKRAVADEEDARDEAARVKVVGDEFVIQSLILGALLEDA